MVPLLPHDEEKPLIAGSEDSTPQNHTRDVHILSVAFLLIFLAYGAAQNLQSTLNTEQDLGTTSLGILYTSLTVFSLVASLVVRILGSKNALVLGTTGHLLYIAANLMPNWFTMIPAYLYLGFCASSIWVGQGTYLTLTARSYARGHNLLEEAVIGDFNGEFWAVLALYRCISLFLPGVIVLLLLNLRITGGFLYFLYPLFLAALLGIGRRIWAAKDMAKLSNFNILFFLRPHISFQAMLVIMLASLLLSFGGFLLLTLQLARTSSSLIRE